VHGVDCQEDAVLRAPVPVQLGESIGNRPHRHLQAGAGVHPRHGDKTGTPVYEPPDPGDDLVRGRGRDVVEEPDLRQRRTRSKDTEPERLVGRVEVVVGGEELLVLAQAEPAVEEPETHRGRVRERDVLGWDAEVIGSGVDDGLLLFELVFEEVLLRRRVEA
jgi:hypothetical protein